MTDVDTGGPIPVRTGEPLEAVRWDGLARAYPRSHGGTAWLKLWPECVTGLSPFARGNPPKASSPLISPGPIPVRTGEPCSAGVNNGHHRAYPRSHGGTSQ